MGKVLKGVGDALSPTNLHGLILYDAPASPCCRRCRITLLEKGQEWDTVNLNLGVMEQRSPDYLAINPNGFVPTLTHGKKVIFESAAINTYLENQFPDIPLLPRDAVGIAAVRMWQSAELAMARVFRPVMYQLTAGPIKRISRSEAENDLITRLETDQPSDLAWERKVYRLEVLKPDELDRHKQWLMDWLQPLESALEGQDYLVNNMFSQADIAVFPRVQMYGGLGLSITPSEFPNLHRWMCILEKRDSFIQSQDELAKKYMEMTRSPMIQKVRKFFATPENERSTEAIDEIRKIGSGIRERLGVERILSASGKGRKLPYPTEGPVAADQVVCEKIRSEVPDNLIIYGNALSPHSHRIELLLNYLGRYFEYVDVDLAAGVNRSGEFLKLNPQGEVPVLCSDDFVIYDSTAIAEYLCYSLDGGTLLLPAMSFDRAKHDMWVALEAGTHKEFTPLLHEIMFAKTPSRRPSISATLKANIVERIRPKLDLLENQLSENEFLMGDTLSYSDICWHSRILSIEQASIAHLVEDYPAIMTWHGELGILLSSGKGQGNRVEYSAA